MAGYSTTPLAKKLGYKPGMTAFVHQAPTNYLDLLALENPQAVTWSAEAGKGITFVHAFASTQAELKKLLTLYRKRLAPDGTLWISWPKKASKVPTDITEDRVRDLALPLGFVDVKVCAVDEIWSGLKLMIRKELR